MHCRTPVVAVATSRQDFELVWNNRAAWGYEEQEGCEASLWRAKDVVDGAHRCVCLSPPNSNAGMMITCAKIQTLRLFLSIQELSSRFTSPILVLQCRYKAVGFVLVVGHNPPPAGVCHLVLADLLDTNDAITAQINTAGES